MPEGDALVPSVTDESEDFAGGHFEQKLEQARKEAHEAGKEEGKIEGKKAGYQEGLEHGRQEGEEEARKSYHDQNEEAGLHLLEKIERELVKLALNQDNWFSSVLIGRCRFGGVNHASFGSSL